MKQMLVPNRYLAVFLGLAFLTLVGWTSSKPTNAGDLLEPGRPGDLVTLISDSSTPICPATSVPHTFGDRLLPDGTRVPFAVPHDHVFVITSFDWVVEGSSQANNNVWTAVTLIGAGTNNALFSGAPVDSIGRAAGSTVVPGGIVVQPGTVMCLDFVGGSSDAFARLHGFLAPKR
jgi:hypothetical protein